MGCALLSPGPIPKAVEAIETLAATTIDAAHTQLEWGIAMVEVVCLQGGCRDLEDPAVQERHESLASAWNDLGYDVCACGYVCCVTPQERDTLTCVVRAGWCGSREGTGRSAWNAFGEACGGTRCTPPLWRTWRICCLNLGSQRKPRR